MQHQCILITIHIHIGVENKILISYDDIVLHIKVELPTTLYDLTIFFFFSNYVHNVANEERKREKFG